MAMYYCDQCGNFLDDDYHPCEEHPKVYAGLMCPECFFNLQEREHDEQERAKDEHSDIHRTR